jgi:hypothetical protein
VTPGRWVRRNRRVLVGACLVLALALVSAVAFADSDGTAASNEAAARADATRLDGRLMLPVSARTSSAEPAGDRSALAGPWSFPATGNLVDLHQWWLVSGSPRSVLAYIRAHPPRGSSLNESSGTSGDGAHFAGLGFGWPADLRVLASRELLVAAAQLPGGVTGLRVDAQDVWFTPRPLSEQIPSAVARLRVTQTRGSRRVLGPFTYASATTLRDVIGLMNSLPAAQPGADHCPAGRDAAIRLRFVGRHGDPAAADAIVQDGRCQVVQLSLGGDAQPRLAGWPIPGHPHATLIGLLEKELGIRFS